jgi:uncharacterized repeat protein (TIGR03833 family)
LHEDVTMTIGWPVGVGFCSGGIAATMGGMNQIKRSDIQPGQRVAVVLKQDQRSGKRTEGVVAEILTKSATHPHGIKVRLQSGAVGRVQAILE